MLHSLILLGSVHAAAVAAAGCSPQYNMIADWVDNFQPAVAWCANQVSVPTSTVIVTTTLRRQKRDATSTTTGILTSSPATPIVLAPVAVSNLLHQTTTTKQKPRPAIAAIAPNAKVRRQFGSSWGRYFYNWMQQNSDNPAIQGVCSCIVDPVTKTLTSTVLPPAAPTTSSVSKPPLLTPNHRSVC